MNIFTRYTRHRLPRPRATGDDLGVAVVLLVASIVLIALANGG
jgi:hypothetical protein